MNKIKNIFKKKTTNSNLIINKKYYNKHKKIDLTNYKSELVCCVYNENIDWIHNEYKNYNKIYIYCKNKNRFNKINKEFSNDKTTIINLENIGSCDYAYLYHIINNYDNLLDIIEFHKGSVNDRKNYYTYNLEEYINNMNLKNIHKLKKNNNKNNNKNNKKNNNKIRELKLFSIENIIIVIK